MASFLPTQEPGPGPTDAPLPTYQSYSAYTTSAFEQTLTVTRIAYDPQATAAPSLDVQTVTRLTTSIGYSVVNVPLLYDGPFPAPPLGTLFTTANQRIIAPSQTVSSNQAQPTTGSGQGQNGGGGSKNGGGGSSNGSGSSNGEGSNNGGSDGSTGAGGNNSGTGGNNGNDGNTSGSGGGNSNGDGGSGGNDNGNGNGGNNGNGNGNGNGNAGSGGSGSAGGSGSSQGGSGNGGQSGGSGTGGSTSPSGPTASAPAIASSASVASVAATSAAASASAASVAASNAAESSAASLASVSAASQASAASAASESAATLTATTSNSGVTTPSSISTGAGNGNPTGQPSPTSDLARNGLSGGQIAGIVIGILAALILALLCLICAARRRRRRRKEAAAAGLTGGAGGGMLGVGSSMRSQDGSRGWRSGFGGSASGGKRGTYAALGAAGAGGAAAAAAAGNRGSVRSEEWEEDQLGSNGSGFYVVGGKNGEADPFRDDGADEQHEYGNVASSGSATDSRAGKKGLLGAGGVAAIGAGLAAVFAGKSRKSSGQGKGKDRLLDSGSAAGHHHDADASMAADDDDAHGERRGLMNFVDADNTADMTAGGDLSEMREAGPSRWSAPISYDPYRSSSGVGVAAAGTAAAAAAAYYAATPRQTDENDQQGRESALSPSAPAYAGWTRYSDSATGGAASMAPTGGGDEPSVVASSSGGSGSNANGPSSHSTGRRTNESLYTTIGAFPRIEEPSGGGEGEEQTAARDDVQTYGNVGPSSKGRIGTFGEAKEGTNQPAGLRSAADSYRGLANLSDDPDEERKLALAAAAATVAAGGSGLGLGALAAHHRHSAASNGNGNGNGADLGDRNQSPAANSLEPRNSRFISRDTPLLGPGFEESRQKTAEEEQFESMLPTFASSHGRTDSYGPHGRLSTIQSVGEFGERGSSSGGGGGGGGGTGGVTGSSAQQSSGSSEAARIRAAHAMGGSGRPASSINTQGAVTADESIRQSGEIRPDSAGNPFASADDATAESSNLQHIGHGSGELAAGAGAAAAGGAGLLGSLAFGWRKLTGSGPSSTAGAADMQRDDSQDAEAAASGLISRRDSGSTNVHHREPHARQRSRGDPGMAAEIHSQRASVITATNHGHDSGNGLRGSSSSGGGGGSGGEKRRSPSGSGNSQSSQRATGLAESATIEEEEREDGERHQSIVSPYANDEEPEEDNGNMADDEDPIGDSSGAMATIATTRDVNTAASRARSSSDNPYDVGTTTTDGPTGETSTRARRDAISEEEAIADTDLSRAGDSASYITTNSPQRPPRRSGEASLSGSNNNNDDRLRLRSSALAIEHSAARHASSGASTGGASYSPSHLVRHSSGAAATASSSMSSSRGTRGGGGRGGRGRGASAVTYDGSEYTSSNSRNNRSNGGGGDTSSRRDTSTLESDGQSSRATAGGGVQDEMRRLSIDQGSLARVHEQREQYDDDDDESPYVGDVITTGTPFYPSESLGAAVRRRAEQDAALERRRGERNDDSVAASSAADQTVTPRVIPMALRVGSGAGAPTTATSNVGSGSGGTSSGTTAIVQGQSTDEGGAGQWRQSPRVETASQRAQQAVAASSSLEQERRQSRQSQLRQQTDHDDGGDLEIGQTSVEGQRNDDDDNNNEEIGDESKRKSAWPKFLRRS